MIDDVERDNPKLSDCAKNRSKAEYCWTCTASILRFFMNRFDLNECTYIDADLFFFNDPSILNDEIQTQKADIAIMPHRFRKGDKRLKRKLQAGKYCVEYNYFNNTENAQNCLNWWADECIKWCYSKYEPASDEYPYERYGDQKYLEQFHINHNMHS